MIANVKESKMEQAKKNFFVKITAAVWAVLVAIDTAGIVDLLPDDFKYAQWIKFGVALLLIIFGMFGYRRLTLLEKQETVNPTIKPPKP